MALFGTDKTKKGNDTAETQKGDADTSDLAYQRADNSLHDVLVRPHITEKATYMTDDDVYAFVVKDSANKSQIKQAVKSVYGVDVVKVRTVTLPKKNVVARSRRAKPGTKGGLKKAYVQLKDGDSIELM